jgi:hypothetical protein
MCIGAMIVLAEGGGPRTNLLKILRITVLDILRIAFSSVTLGPLKYKANYLKT